MLRVPAVGATRSCSSVRPKGDADEGVSLLVEIGDEALALVGDGWHVCGHALLLQSLRWAKRSAAGRSRPRGGSARG